MAQTLGIEFVPLAHWWTSRHTGTHVCTIVTFYCAALIRFERLLFVTMMDPPVAGIEQGKIGDQTGRKIHDGQMNLGFDRLWVTEVLDSCLDECDSPFDFGTSYGIVP